MTRATSACLLALAILCAALWARGALACEMFQFNRVQASPHVVVFQAAEGTTGVVNGNIVAVIGREAILVVDTGQFPSIARRVIAELASISEAPVRHVVNTHWHGDHLLANGAFKAAFPGVRFIAHSHTISEAKKYYDGYAAKMSKHLPIVVEEMRKQREDSKDEEQRLWLAKTMECVELAVPEAAATDYVAPDQVVDTEIRLDLGGVHAHVRHLGAGNTPGDLVVWVEEDRVAAVGDVLVYPAPYAIGSTLGPWIPTLERVRALKPAVIVPGHGPVMRDDAYLVDVIALLTHTESQLGPLHAKGLTRREAAAALDTAAFSAKYVTTPMRRQAFEQFFKLSAVHRVWSAAEAAKKAATPPA